MPPQVHYCNNAPSSSFSTTSSFLPPIQQTHSSNPVLLPRPSYSNIQVNLPILSPFTFPGSQILPIPLIPAESFYIQKESHKTQGIHSLIPSVQKKQQFLEKLWTEDDFSNLKVPQLKKELQIHGVKFTSKENKLDLQKMLRPKLIFQTEPKQLSLTDEITIQILNEVDSEKDNSQQTTVESSNKEQTKPRKAVNNKSVQKIKKSKTVQWILTKAKEDNTTKLRKYVTVDKKQAIIDEVVNSNNNPEVIKQLTAENNLHQTTVGKWSKLKPDIKKLVNLYPGLTSRKKLQIGEFPLVEKAVYTFYLLCQKKNIPVSQLMLKTQALEFYNKFSPHIKMPPVFNTSNGWLYGFQMRHGIHLYNMHGESGSIPENVILEGREFLKPILSQWKLEDIYNADETALFWRLGPNATLETKAINGTKIDKSRFTVLVCSNALGEKSKLVVIGNNLFLIKII